MHLSVSCAGGAPLYVSDTLSRKGSGIYRSTAAEVTEISTWVAAPTVLLTPLNSATPPIHFVQQVVDSGTETSSGRSSGVRVATVSQSLCSGAVPFGVGSSADLGNRLVLRSYEAYGPMCREAARIDLCGCRYAYLVTSWQGATSVVQRLARSSALAFPYKRAPHGYVPCLRRRRRSLSTVTLPRLPGAPVSKIPVQLRPNTQASHLRVEEAEDQTRRITASLRAGVRCILAPIRGLHSTAQFSMEEYLCA